MIKPSLTFGFLTKTFTINESATSAIFNVAMHFSALNIGKFVVEPFHSALFKAIILLCPLMIFFALDVCPSMLISQVTILLKEAEKKTVSEVLKSTESLLALNGSNNLKLL